MGDATTQYIVLRNNPKSSSEATDGVYGESGALGEEFEKGNFGLLSMAPMDAETCRMMDKGSVIAGMVSSSASQTAIIYIPDNMLGVYEYTHSQ